MRIDRTTITAVGLWAMALWAIGGVMLTRDVVSTSRAADVVAASALCPPACPVDAAPSWLAVAVMAAWVLVAVGSLVAMAVVVRRRLLRADDT